MCVEHEVCRAYFSISKKDAVGISLWSSVQIELSEFIGGQMASVRRETHETLYT